MQVELTDAERAAFLELAEEFSQKLSSAGSNDMLLVDTEQNRTLIREADMYAGWGEDELQFPEDRGELCANNQYIWDYLMSKFQTEEEKEADRG